MNIQTEINDDIKFLAKSEIRLKILSELNKKPNNVRGLVKKTKITYSSVSSNILKLEKNNYLKKIKNMYHVTPMAELYFNSLMDFKNSADLINKNISFWNKHNIDQFSTEAAKSITDLKNSTIIETTPIDIYKTHNTTKEQLIQSKNVRAIFPYLHPEYPKIIEQILNNDGYVELIIPEMILKEIINQIDHKIRNHAMKNRKLTIYKTSNNLDLYLTICDESMSLGLFKSDGSFDQNRILISSNPKSQKWANNLFEHVKNQVIE